MSELIAANLLDGASAAEAVGMFARREAEGVEFVVEPRPGAIKSAFLDRPWLVADVARDGGKWQADRLGDWLRVSVPVLGDVWFNAITGFTSRANKWLLRTRPVKSAAAPFWFNQEQKELGVRASDGRNLQSGQLINQPVQLPQPPAAPVRTVPPMPQAFVQAPVQRVGSVMWGA